MQLQSGNR